MVSSSCVKCDKANDVVRTSSFKPFSKTLIPSINGSIEFISDSNMSIVFDDVSTEHGFNKYKTCMCIECCCNDYVNQESTRQLYISNKKNVSFQVYLGAGDSIDFVRFGMYKMSSDTSEYVSFLRYFDNENPLKLTTDSIANCKFLATKTINNKVFNNVYVISGKTDENKKFADEVYYTSKEGIVGYKLNDKSIWIIKQ